MNRCDLLNLRCAFGVFLLQIGNPRDPKKINGCLLIVVWERSLVILLKSVRELNPLRRYGRILIFEGWGLHKLLGSTDVFQQYQPISGHFATQPALPSQSIKVHKKPIAFHMPGSLTLEDEGQHPFYTKKTIKT